MKRLDTLSLKYFNSVLESKSPVATISSTVEDIQKQVIAHGYIFDIRVFGRFDIQEIANAVTAESLDGERINKTFRKSWDIVQNTSDHVLRTHQIMHYITTYGYEALGVYSHDTVYIPSDVLELPEIKADKIPLTVIKCITEKELQDKAEAMLASGIALKHDTMTDMIKILDETSYNFAANLSTIKNKEALAVIYKKYNLVPANTSDFVRYIVNEATQETLVINSKELLSSIRCSGYDISNMVERFGYEKLSASFLRYKKIFLAFKSANINNKPVVNRLRKLAKKNHKPMPVDYLNTFLSAKEIVLEDFENELGKVNNFRKLRVIKAINDRLASPTTRVYRIRNGKSETARTQKFQNEKTLQVLLDSAKSVLAAAMPDMMTKTVYMPSNISYGLPTSEKSFIGNIPFNTKVNFEEHGIFGIYWENEWGARDLDLSSMSANVKVGWNSAYKNADKTLLYSGDVTNAPNGASEMLYAKDGLSEPWIITNNIFSGAPGCKMKMYLGSQDAKSFGSNFMLDANNVMMEVETSMDSRQKCLGMFIPEGEKTSYVFADFGTGTSSVSGSSEKSEIIREHTFMTSLKGIYVDEILKLAGANVVNTYEENDEQIEIDIDLSPEKLEKDTFIKMFS